MTHTPGPWTVRTDRWNSGHPSDPDMIASIYAVSDDWNVAEVWGIPPPVAIEDRQIADAAIANARLIAAAPDLLVALKAAEQFITPEIDRGPAINGWQNTVDIVREAITKAEGRVATEAVK